MVDPDDSLDSLPGRMPTNLEETVEIDDVEGPAKAVSRSSVSSRNRMVRESTRNNLEPSGTHSGTGTAWTDDEVQQVKERLRESMKKNAPYNVHSLYHKTGFWQFVAKHTIFENMTLFVIAINAIWMAVDTDLNGADNLMDAHIVFIIGENFFCTYFSGEWVIRFMAFKWKRDGLRDGWFVFDSCLVFLMVMETWVFVAISGGGESPLGNAAILRLFRLLRLSRLLRMLRSLPELMILIKGMVTAMQSVVYVMVLLVLFTYVFAIACTQLSLGYEFHELYFDNVSMSMYSLIIYATFLDNLSQFLDDIRLESPATLVFAVVFICLSALTVLNMLIGVLCEVVSAVAATERETIMTERVTSQLSEVMLQLDHNYSGSISMKEFRKVMEEDSALRIFSEVGVDPVAMVDFADVIFRKDGVLCDIPYQKFIDTVLDLRDSNEMKVKDLMNLWQQVNAKHATVHEEAEEVSNAVNRASYDVMELKEATEGMESALGAVLNEVRNLSQLQMADIYGARLLWGSRRGSSQPALSSGDVSPEIERIDRDEDRRISLRDSTSDERPNDWKQRRLADNKLPGVLGYRGPGAASNGDYYVKEAQWF